jgi:predicted O-linked N-acetylglucosamine transferase (SPINDLY family)
MHSVPASRLVLKAKPFACPTARQHVASQLAAAGVAAWRFDLLPLAASTADHLGVYGLMDISLDTFPYAGVVCVCVCVCVCVRARECVCVAACVPRASWRVAGCEAGAWRARGCR